MQVFAIPLGAPAEPDFINVKDDAPAALIYDTLKAAIRMNLALDMGQVGAGPAFATNSGWSVGLEIQTFRSNEVLLLPLPLAERFAAYLTERAAAGACDCPACTQMHGFFAEGFPKVVEMVREKIATNAPEPTAEEVTEATKRAGEWAMLHGEPAGRA